jgi:hypothetical protein
MTVPTITFRGGVLEVVLATPTLLVASVGTASSAARLLIVARNVLLLICQPPFDIESCSRTFFESRFGPALNELAGRSTSPVAAGFRGNTTTIPAGARATMRFIGNEDYSPPPTLTKEKPK